MSQPKRDLVGDRKTLEAATLLVFAGGSIELYTLGIKGRMTFSQWHPVGAELGSSCRKQQKSERKKREWQ